eukprot:2675110-Pyramimonas_sp.AAC.1
MSIRPIRFDIGLVGQTRLHCDTPTTRCNPVLACRCCVSWPGRCDSMRVSGRCGPIRPRFGSVGFPDSTATSPE